MGAVAQELADWAVVTSDNPRSESADSIAREIVAGMRGGNHEIILDRREAIHRAVSMAQAQDIVLIAGKGHETTQTIGATVLPFDDLSVAKEAVEARPVEFGR
jgi:UDP-N-acetylmuramoyl-L-alanyl-D-glutamate--2,6-diaminopimelate ligase